jgi:DNA-binding CsgD family transcriptional regulator
MTPRQRDVMKALAFTGDQQAAADLLGMSPLTLKRHLTNVYAALGVQSVVSAFRELGWLALPFETRAAGEVALGNNVLAVALT